MTTNLLDVFGAGGATTSHHMYVPQISSSCPPEVKEEKMRETCPFGINPSTFDAICKFINNYCASFKY